MNSYRSWGLLLLLVLLAAGPALAQPRHRTFDHDETIERTFDVRPGQTLFLDTDRGAVVVRGSSGDQVRVTVVKGVDDVSRDRADELFDAFTLDFDQTSDGVEIRGDMDDDHRWRRRNLQVYFEISVPRRFALDIETAGGSIWAEGLDGHARLHTSGGAITAREIDGEIDLDTSGGSVTAEHIGGRAHLETSGGSITARDIAGDLICDTSGGSITVDEVRGNVEASTSGGSIRLEEIYGTVNAETSGGSITADVAVQPEAPMHLETSGGTVTLHLAEGTRADIDARASGGSVRTDLPVSVRGELARSRLQGEINGGGPLLTLRSSGGGIKIYKR